MATTITRALADVYFAADNHILSAVWLAFDETTLRDPAIAHAIRECSQSLGVDIENETIDENDYYYPDRAVYEQALFILNNSSHTSNGESAAPKWQTVDRDGSDKEKERNFMGPDAQRWLLQKQGSSLKVARGG